MISSPVMSTPVSSKYLRTARLPLTTTANIISRKSSAKLQLVFKKTIEHFFVIISHRYTLHKSVKIISQTARKFKEAITIPSAQDAPGGKE